MTELTKPDPNRIEEQFQYFAEGIGRSSGNMHHEVWAFANRLSEETDGQKLPDPPSTHHGNNLLLANWGSSQERLKRIYRIFRETATVIEELPLSRPVIICPGRDVSKLDSIHQVDKPDAIEDGGIELIIGRLAANELNFQYRANLKQGGSGKNTVKAPYFLASAGIVLSDICRIEYGISRKQTAPKPEQTTASIVELGATLKGNTQTYRSQNYALVSPMIIGQSACRRFLSSVEEAYFIGDHLQADIV